MGKFTISNRANGLYYFNLKAGNSEIILTSEGYTTKASCMNGIESVKRNSTSDSRFDRLTSANGKYYFVLKAGNGEIVGTSELYTTTAARENGIEAVKNNAPSAWIDHHS